MTISANLALFEDPKNLNEALIQYKNVGLDISYGISGPEHIAKIEDLQHFLSLGNPLEKGYLVLTYLYGANGFKSHILDSSQIYKVTTKSLIAKAFDDMQYINIVGHDEGVGYELIKNRSLIVDTGRTFDDTSEIYECLIDKHLAKVRNINQGDTIDLYVDDLKYEVLVAGIYTSSALENTMEKEQVSDILQPSYFEDLTYNIKHSNFSTIYFLYLWSRKIDYCNKHSYFPSIYVNSAMYNEIKNKNSYGIDVNFKVTGFSSDAVMSDFIKGKKTIAYGKVFDTSSDSFECVISIELAKKNGIRVGDMITLCGGNKNLKSYTIEVIGIYTDSEFEKAKHVYYTPPSTGVLEAGTYREPDAMTISLEDIYMSFPAVMKIVTDINSSEPNPVFAHLKLRMAFQTPNEMNLMYRSIIKNDYSLRKSFDSEDTQEYFDRLTVVRRTTTFALAAFAIEIAVAIFFLFMFNIYNMKERKYEIGVLTSMGMSKGKIALQFFLEIIIVVLSATIIGSVLGTVTARPISDYLTRISVENFADQETTLIENFGRNVDISYINEKRDLDVNASVNLVALLQLWGSFVLIVIISTSGTINVILCFEPLSVLNEV